MRVSGVGSEAVRTVAAGFVIVCVTSIGCAQVAHELATGVVRFDADDAARESAVPSLSFADPAQREGGRAVRIDRAGVPVPVFGTDGRGRHTATISIDTGTSLYGTGEIGGPLERTGKVTEAWNSDKPGYAMDEPSLYQSHPWVLAVRADGSAFGVLADTTHRCEIDLTDGIRFAAEGPEFPVIVIEGESPQQVMIRLGDMIGRIEMPPLWALGYHQCRWSYYPDWRALMVAKEFRRRHIPADVIWHDIHYMDDYLVFTFDPERFPDPARHNRQLAEIGFRNVWMIDPGVGIRDGYSVYEELRDRDLAVLDANGEQFVGPVWPGPCLFPDYTMAEAREWWAGLYKDFMATGIDGVWNDMNEPAVFNDLKTMPEDNFHRADEAFGGPHTHDRFHNVYGMLMAQASYEGILDANPDKRPFLLTRANFIGGHRVAATWTGDNVASWEHLEMTVPMILNLGLSGQPFSGPDIGGFLGEGGGGQFGRWMGFGALLPFARGHTASGEYDKEPWSYRREVENISRLAIRRRYQLMPFFYTLFHESHETGLPVMRPLFFADPADQKLRTADEGFLLGSALMVFPQLHETQRRDPIFPDVGWRPVRLDGAGHRELPEMFVRHGSIIPLGPDVQYTTEKPLDPLTLVVSLDDAGRAEGTLYEDAGEGWAFRDGEYRKSTYTATRDGNAVIVTRSNIEGRMRGIDRPLIVRLLTDHGEFVASGRDDGRPIRLVPPQLRVLASDEAGDPAYRSGWNEPSRGGTGFGAWRFVHESARADGAAGRFIADRNDQDLDHTRGQTSGRAFGIYAKDGAGREVSIAQRALPQPANRAGRSFEIDLEVGIIGRDGVVGVALTEDAGWSGGDALDGAAAGVIFRGGRATFDLIDNRGIRETDARYTNTGLRLVFVFRSETRAEVFAYRHHGPLAADGEPVRLGTVTVEQDTELRGVRLFSADNADQSNGNFYFNRMRLSDRLSEGNTQDRTGDGLINDWDAIRHHKDRSFVMPAE